MRHRLLRARVTAPKPDYDEPVLDDDQITELRNWAKGLAQDDTRPELRAAAKAILLLADDLLAARSQLLEYRWIKQALEEHEATLEQTLRQRLRRLLRARASQSAAED